MRQASVSQAVALTLFEFDLIARFVTADDVDQFVAAANRAPFDRHDDVALLEVALGQHALLLGRRATTRFSWMQPASGLVTALDPVMRACGGT